jgi:hypothetical protein
LPGIYVFFAGALSTNLLQHPLGKCEGFGEGTFASTG